MVERLSKSTGVDTWVFLMVGSKIEEICAACVEQSGGARPPSTPAALVRWAGHPEQKVWRSTLAEMADATRGEELSPAVLVVGEVAGLNLLADAPQPR